MPVEEGLMTIRIVTDSTCDLPEELVAATGVSVVPLVINIAGKSYLDGVEISRRQFYEGLPGYAAFPTTSVPSPGDFCRAYEGLASEGATDIISIHISPTLSAVTNSARLAVEETRSARVWVVDSRQLSMGTGFMVLAAAKAVARGLPAEEVVSELDRLAPRLHVFAVLDTVEFLRRSGRMNGIQFGVASLLGIKPLLKMNDGRATSEKVRTRRAARERLLDLVAGLGPLEEVALVHTSAPERAEELWQEARAVISSPADPVSVEVTPVIGAHIGPGAVGFACVAAG
jgi:DegV family protein with EDD domain